MFSDRFRAVKVNSMRNCRGREEEAEPCSDTRRASWTNKKAKQLQFLSRSPKYVFCQSVGKENCKLQITLLFQPHAGNYRTGSFPDAIALFVCTFDPSLPISLCPRETLLRYTVFDRIPGDLETVWYCALRPAGSCHIVTLESRCLA